MITVHVIYRPYSIIYSLGLGEPECTESDLKKSPDLSHLGPIWPNFVATMTSLEHASPVASVAPLFWLILILLTSFLSSKGPRVSEITLNITFVNWSIFYYLAKQIVVTRWGRTDQKESVDLGGEIEGSTRRQIKLRATWVERAWDGHFVKASESRAFMCRARFAATW